MIGLLFDCDEHVASTLFEKHVERFIYNRAVGFVRDGVVIGGFIFTNDNGANVELSYYGSNCVTPGIIRCVSRWALLVFNPARVTVVISKKRRKLARSLQKLGFAVEGTQRRYYGAQDCNRNTGVRFVLFREKLEHLAGHVTAQQEAM